MGLGVGRRNRIRWRFGAIVEQDSIVWSEGMIYDEVVEVVVLEQLDININRSRNTHMRNDNTASYKH